jgi:hypothetical protein
VGFLVLAHSSVLSVNMDEGTAAMILKNEAGKTLAGGVA